MLTEPTLADGLAFLDRHINLEATKAIAAGHSDGLSLDSMRALMVLLGDPQTDVSAVHLTGTNGKGSTGAMISRLLHVYGLTVGTYSSPHLSLVNERIRLNGESIEDDDFAELLAVLEVVAGHLDNPPSYFELLTAAAFRYFADVAVDAAVIEVGMLGRTDATNVVDARVAVVTNIGYDHTDGAPGWREAIAQEKAGIIKPGATAILGMQSIDVRPFFFNEGASEVLVLGEDFTVDQNKLAVDGRLLSVRTQRSNFEDVFVSLHGHHQGANTALALAATEAYLDAPLPDDVVEAALGSMTLPGRFERVHANPLIVVDGAHNPDGAEAAARTISEDFVHGGRHFLIVGILDGRDPVAMLQALEAPGADLVIACTPPSSRGLDAEILADAARSIGARVEVADSPEDAVDRALLVADEGDAIFAVGSMYLAGAVRDFLINND